VIESPAATAWYVYGVVAAGAAEPDEVRLIEQGGLAAVAREVPLADFGEDSLPQRLNDPEWLEASVLAHEEVLQAFVETGVVPLRFGAIYRDAREVERMLEARSVFFHTALARLGGHVEIGVKGWLVAPGPPPSRVEPTAAGGRAYLERRRDELAAARASADRVVDAVRSVHRQLFAVAADGVVNRPQPKELTGRSDEMVLNAAYLVPVGDRTLVQTVSRLAAESAEAGIELEVTGPWPPYNFVPDDEEPDA
jgi:Gas vesicle synthesis protein GvpL/GvpF